MTADELAECKSSNDSFLNVMIAMFAFCGCCCCLGAFGIYDKGREVKKYTHVETTETVTI